MVGHVSYTALTKYTAAQAVGKVRPLRTAESRGRQSGKQHEHFKYENLISCAQQILKYWLLLCS